MNVGELKHRYQSLLLLFSGLRQVVLQGNYIQAQMAEEYGKGLLESAKNDKEEETVDLPQNIPVL